MASVPSTGWATLPSPGHDQTAATDQEHRVQTDDAIDYDGCDGMSFSLRLFAGDEHRLEEVPADAAQRHLAQEESERSQSKRIRQRKLKPQRADEHAPPHATDRKGGNHAALSEHKNIPSLRLMNQPLNGIFLSQPHEEEGQDGDCQRNLQHNHQLASSMSIHPRLRLSRPPQYYVPQLSALTISIPSARFASVPASANNWDGKNPKTPKKPRSQEQKTPSFPDSHVPEGLRQRGISSVGRAFGWQPKGHRFEPGILHCF